MSPRATALFCSFLAGALLVGETVSGGVLRTGTSASAEEADEPMAPAPDAQDDVLAGEIGRALLSSDAMVRAKAVRRLSKRLNEGHAIERFLNAMSKAQEAWANEHARMLEVWLAEAVSGVGEERERAIRLLSALGPHAIRRLADELRHERHHGTGTSWHRNEPVPPEDSKEESEAPEHAETNDATPQENERPAGIPYRYELRDLIADGWGRFELRSVLLREGDASRVVPHDTGYVVTASAKGHDRLRTYLTVLRSGQTGIRPAPQQEAPDTEPTDKRDDKQEDKHEDKPAPGATPPPTVEGLAPGTQSAGTSAQGAPAQGIRAAAGGRQRAAGMTLEAKKPVPSAAAENPPAFKLKIPQPATSGGEGTPTELVELKQELPPQEKPAARPEWRVEPMILFLPSSKALGARLAADAYAYEERKAPFENSRALTGTLADVKHWASVSGRMPEARADVNLSGNVLLAPGRSTRLLSGKTIRYSKDVRRQKGGAWRILEGTIHEGIEIEVAIIRQASGLRVDVVAQRTDVGSPMSVVSVRPSRGSVAVELERPEWSTTRLATSFVLPGESGGAFLPLEGLGMGPDEEVVLVLAVAPHANRPAVRKSRVILPQNRK